MLIQGITIGMQQSVGLVWSYFCHPDFLVVQCWICTTFLFLDTVTQTGPQVYHYVKLFLGGQHAYWSSVTVSWLSWIILMSHDFHYNYFFCFIDCHYC